MSAKDIERLAKEALEIHHGEPLAYPVAATTTAFVRAILQALREPSEEAVLAICAKAAEEHARPVAIHRKDAADLVNAYLDHLLAE